MKKWPKWVVPLVLVLIVTLAISGCSQEEETVKETELTVGVATAQNQYIAQTAAYSGLVRGINEVDVTPKILGRVTAIYVKPGDWVEKGQALLTLDSTSLQAARKQAEAALAGAQAQEAANKLQLENARLNYERMQQLHEAGALSDSALESARLQYESLNSGAVEASVKSAEAALASLQDQIESCNLTAPISGIVGAINLSLGDNASLQSAAAVISDTSRLEVEILVSESEVNYIQVGSEVDVAVTAVSEQPFTGIVDSVSSATASGKTGFTVKVIFENPDGITKSGMFAEVSLATVSAENALCVPRNAVVPREGRTIVYTVDKEQRARKIEVETGVANNDYIQVTKGLQEGTRVITSGNTLVNEGTLVRVITGGDK